MHAAGVAEYLLAKGHTNVLHYTLGQALVFYNLANIRERGESGNTLWLSRVAYHAVDKDYKSVLQKLG